MRYRPLGQSGIEASVVGLGTWVMGGWAWGGADEGDAIDAVRAALDQGITLIDTAPAYGLGRSEDVVGRALKGRRDQAVLATKCGLVWHARKGEHYFDELGKPVHRYLGPESIRHEVEESLRRLRTDHIDLYQTHWPDATTPIEDTMAELARLKEAGKIRAIGVSNVSIEQMARYRAVGPVDSDQEKYSMLDRELDADRLPYCRENRIAVLAYSPLASGLLTGKIGPEREFPEDDLRSARPRFSVENRERVAELLRALKPIADTHGITFAQLAIAWTVAQPGLTHALVGARNPAQATENAAAGDVVLSDVELKTIDAVIRDYKAAAGL